MSARHRDGTGEDRLLSVGGSGPFIGLLDRKDSEETSERIFATPLAVLRELVDEATRFVVRAYVTSARDTADVVLLAILFPRVIKLLDSIETLVRVGQTYGARIIVRSVLEASWGIEWMLQRDTAQRARQYYVIELRDKIASNEAFIPGTTAYDSYIKDISVDQQRGLGLPADAVEIATKEIERIRRHIQRFPDFRVIDEEVDRQKKSGAKIHWFQLFAGPRNFAELARELGHSDEYRSVYKGLSHVVHGTYTQDHIWVEGGGIARLQPIRDINETAGVLDLVWAAGLRVYHMMLMHHRPGELEAFKNRFFPEGKPRFEVPEIEIQHDLQAL